MKTLSMTLLMVASFALSACGKVAPAASTSTSTSGGLQENPAQSVSESKIAVKTGNWSSANSNAELSVTDTGATLTLGCGNGALNTVLALDVNNAFTVVGVYASDSSAAYVPAVYSGAYDTDSESLTVIISVAATGETISKLVLNFGDLSSPVYCGAVR